VIRLSDLLFLQHDCDMGWDTLILLGQAENQIG